MKLQHVKLIQELNNWEIRRVERLKQESKFEKFTGLIHAAELHIPFTVWDYVFDMMKEAKAYTGPGKKVFISGGDSMNLDMISFFYKKNGTKKTPMEELEILIKFLREAEKVYDHIIFLETNHERRIFKFLINNLQQRDQAVAMMEFMQDIRKIFEENGLKKITYINDCFFMVGRAIFSHFENNSMVAGKIVRDVIAYLTPRIEKQWDVCFQFHTHTQSQLAIDRKVGIECGACCETMDYWRAGKLSGTRKMSSIGYGRGIFKSGIPYLNQCGFVLKGWEGYL